MKAHKLPDYTKGRAESRARDAARSTRPSKHRTEIRNVLLILIPLVWLAVTALVVAACQTASRGDGDAAPAGSGSGQDERAHEAPRLVLVAGPAARGQPPRPLEQVRGAVRAPASASLPP